MSVNYNYKRGIDTPTWEWLAPFPGGVSYHGTSNVYDGARYLYWIVQRGATSTTASATDLYRYCTWTDSWHYLAAVTNSNRGADVEFDPFRNCLYIIHGAALASWQTFNLNKTNITICGQTCAPFVLTTMTTVLPATADYGASLTFPNDLDVADEIWSGTIEVATTTTLREVADSTKSAFQAGMEGLTVRFTSGAQNGQRRTIASVQDADNLTFAPALPGAPSAGDTYVIEPTNGTSTASTTTTLTDSTASWITNQYANHDVIIGGQRRRIASNTATVLTLSAAVTGNSDTGPFSPAPANGAYQIVTSHDFLYYQRGSGGANFYKIDVSQTSGAAWASLASVPAAPGGGGNTMYPGSMAPSTILCFRGSASASFYQYDIGTNSWITLTFYGLANTISTGGAAAMIGGLRRILLHQEATTRLLVANLATQQIEPFGTIPYTNPGGYDGKRLRAIKTVDGARFIYILRAGGQEFFRVPIEWV